MTDASPAPRPARPSPSDSPPTAPSGANCFRAMETLEPRRLMSATTVTVAPGFDASAAIGALPRRTATRASYPLPSSDFGGGVSNRLAAGFVGPVQALRAGSPFYLFDALDGAPGPAGGLYGTGGSAATPRATFLDAAGLTPDRARAAARAAASAGELLVLDVSSLRLDGRTDSASDVDRDLAHARRSIDWLKAERPTVQVGLYGAGPLFESAGGDWDLLKRFMADQAGPRGRYRNDYLAWRSANDALAPLLVKADFLAPSLETAYLDPEGWGDVARASIAEARRVSGGAPVLAVLSPEVGAGSRHAGRSVPEGLWSDQLELAFGFADGAIVAGGPGRATGAGMESHGVSPDGTGADWRASTVQFVQDHGGQPARVPVSGDSDAATRPVAVNHAETQNLFPVYDVLENLGRPSSAALGLEPMHFANHHSTTDVALRQQADFAADHGVPLMLNIYEHAKVDVRTSDPATVRAELAKIEHAIDVLETAQPGLEYGLYSIFPRRDLWNPVKAESARQELAANDAGLTAKQVAAKGDMARHYEKGADGKYRLANYARNSLLTKVRNTAPAEAAWQAANARLAAVAARVPVIYPSIYLFYDDPELNALYIKAQVAEAKKYLRPDGSAPKVVPVLMLRYHESDPTLGGRVIGDDMLRLAVRAAGEAGADGLSLWGGPVQWTSGDGHAAATVRDEAAEVAAEREDASAAR